MASAVRSIPESRQHRESYVVAMRAYNAGEVEKRMRSWEMEDKDLSAENRA